MTVLRLDAYCHASAAPPVDVLVASGFFMALDPKQAARCRPFPPLSSLQLAALFRERSMSVAVFDAMLAPDETDFEAALVKLRCRAAASNATNPAKRGNWPWTRLISPPTMLRQHRPRS